MKRRQLLLDRRGEDTERSYSAWIAVAALLILFVLLIFALRSVIGKVMGG